MPSDRRALRAWPFALLVLGGCLDPIPENTLTVTYSPDGLLAGVVRDACTSAPVSNVSIQTYSVDIWDEGWGRYGFSGKNGDYRIYEPTGTTWKLYAGGVANYLTARENMVFDELFQSLDLYLVPDTHPEGPPPPRKIDLLLVVDTSSGMAWHQRRFSRAFDSLIRGGFFEGMHGNRGSEDKSTSPVYPQELQLRIGATTSDLCRTGQGGQLATAPGCGRSPSGLVFDWKLTRRYDPWGKVEQIVSETSDDGITEVRAAVESCLVEFGEQGCSYQRPLQAALNVLDSGFHSSADAALVVVILTHGDDCELDSRTDSMSDDPATAALHCLERSASCKPGGWDLGKHWECQVAAQDRLERITPMAEHLRSKGAFVAVVAGDRGPIELVSSGGKRAVRSVCQHTEEQVAPSSRLRGLVDELRPYATIASLCSPLEGVLANVGAKAAQTTLLWPCPRR
jgi:hypothetical protein